VRSTSITRRSTKFAPHDAPQGAPDFIRLSIRPEASRRHLSKYSMYGQSAVYCILLHVDDPSIYTVRAGILCCAYSRLHVLSHLHSIHRQGSYLKLHTVSLERSASIEG
jgi:hypothetical protein